MKRDEFDWLSAINQATILINTEQGLLPEDVAKKAAQAVADVIREGEEDASKRPKTYITYEPRMLEKGGAEISLMHAGRSSQDMHATYRAAIMRDEILEVSEALNQTMEILTNLAAKNVDTIVPNYTNGVPAQPNSYAHYLFGYLASFERDQQKLRECYERINYSPMGTTVLNGTSWPLNNQRMAQYLAFKGPVSNAYDAAQTKPIDELIEISGIITGIALHIGTFVQDVMTQYAQPRPWIMLQEGGDNTYVSSAMPQKRNPGLLINIRRDASTVVGDAQSMITRAHNIAPGFIDPKGEAYWPTLQKTIKLLQTFNKCLLALRINPERAFEELNLDWTASQEIADYLVREYKLPFRVGHHFASHMVSYAREHDIKPLDFPYPEAVKIYAEVIKTEYPQGNPELPITAEQLKSILNPREIVKSRRTYGGPQPAEMDRQLREMEEKIAHQERWVTEKKENINKALNQLDEDFVKVLNGPGQ